MLYRHNTKLTVNANATCVLQPLRKLKDRISINYSEYDRRIYKVYTDYSAFIRSIMIWNHNLSENIERDIIIRCKKKFVDFHNIRYNIFIHLKIKLRLKIKFCKDKD